MTFIDHLCVLSLPAAIIVLAYTIARGAAPAPIQEQRFALINCRPDVRTCIVFDTATGDLTPRALPSLPSTGEQEVRN